MDTHEIVHRRLANQRIAGAKFEDVHASVPWMGAMQAQDFSMAKLAIGVRSHGITEAQVEEAFANGEILRTHLLRPTWHFVSPNDIAWMVELSAPHIKAMLKSRHTGLGLTQQLVDESNSLIDTALSPGIHLTRGELVGALEAGGLSFEDKQAYYHLILIAELDGVVCSGAVRDGQQTYARFAERVPKAPAVGRDEALRRLAERYFTSHGPATIRDYAWWSGLPIADAKRSIELCAQEMVPVPVGSEEYIFRRSSAPTVEDRVYLLPAYDEFIISYKSREIMLSAPGQSAAISGNGVFRPVFVVDGRIAGIWSRAVKKTVKISARPFNPLSNGLRRRIEEEFLTLQSFFEKKVEITWE